jgi:FKBP-type peptidyl-prolyl cis-trans isomerase (trigger factor)
MTGAETHLFPEMELDEQKDALMEAAVFEVKEPLVLKDLTKKLDIAVTPEELLAEGEAIAERQNSTLDEVKRFFGKDLTFLERDVRERKIRDWACSQ